VVKNIFAAGCVSWKASIGVGDGTPGLLPAIARKMLKLLGVLRGKAGVRMGDEVGVTAVGKTKPDG
jgi:hypothetical protein